MHLEHQQLSASTPHIIPPCRQAEHGPDSQAVLVALPGVDIEAVQQEVQRQCDLLPRAETTRRALSHSRIVQAGSREEAAALSNRWAAGCVSGWGRLGALGMQQCGSPGCTSWLVRLLVLMLLSLCNQLPFSSQRCACSAFSAQLRARAPDCECGGRGGVAAAAGQRGVGVPGPLHPRVCGRLCQR